ncbi:MAG: DSD1 family PLP-dependent enzyme [Cypionkella sp.]|nr:DSD1 family PLP-dependent enzyme [Cypionkella sp.]
MNSHTKFEGLEVGYDIPALPGMDEADIQTPCLILDLDALERNIKKMGDYARSQGMRHRVHGKMHKSVDVAKLQESLGGSCGVCCQKVSEAEVFARGGIKDVLVSNQVRDPAKIDRLARIPKLGARTIVCVDDIANVADLSAAAVKHGTTIECLVEIDCGAGRCGVKTTPEVVAIAKAIDAAPGLKFSGLQAYQGAMQHMDSYDDRKAKIDIAVAMVKDAVDTLKAEGLECDIVGGGGTGSYYFESTSGVYNELQCGSYAFMDADYGRILDKDGKRIDQGEWENALFILTSVMSHAKADKAIVDAGLKAQSVDSGLPVINDKLRLVPGHCDPTCNVHDWYVGVRGGKVEVVWPVSARGKAY